MASNFYSPMNGKASKLLILIFICLVTTSCIKDNDFDFDMNQGALTPEIAVPLICAKIGMNDLLKDNKDVITINPDNSLSLIYKTEETESQSVDELIKIPNQQFNLSHKINLDTRKFSNKFSFEKSFDMDFGENDYEIESIHFKDTKMDLGYNIPNGISTTIYFANITDPNGNPLSIDLPNTYSKITIDLKGYKMQMGTQRGSFLKIKVDNKINTENLLPFENKNLIFDIKLRDISFKTFIGYAGSQEMIIEDSSDLGLFQKAIQGEMKFDKINFGLILKNSFGLPVELSIEKVCTVKDGIETEIVDLKMTTMLNSPSIEQMGEYAITENFQSIESSDLCKALLSNPEKIKYRVKLKLNPENKKNNSNFILENSNVKVQAKINIPLKGSISNFCIQDTVDFDLKDLDNMQNINLRLNTKNTFPLDAKLQLYFCNNDYKTLDSLFDSSSKIIKAGNFNNNQVTPSEYKIDIPLSINKTNALKSAKYLLIKANLNTDDAKNKSVIIYNDACLDLKLGVKSLLSL
ncbi:MAG: hypothetical protein ACEPOW_06980 [Bacteroidales bacterium]